MIAHLRISTFVLLLLAASTAVAGPKGRQSSGSEGRQSSGSESARTDVAATTAVLDDIQQGWTSQNAEMILRHFGSNKVVISIDGSGPGGSYSKDQGYYVFKELFKATVTRKFVFVQIRKSNDEGTASFAIAERRYQRRDDGRQVKDKVYIALHLEDEGRWVLDEIKSIR